MNQRIEVFENELLMEEETDDSIDMTREEAIDRLMAELQRGLDSVKSEADWISEEEAYRLLGVKR